MAWPADSHITSPADIRRLSDQNQRVLARLQRGPATRHELQALASNITARISDLREAGYDIPTPVRSVYRLKQSQESKDKSLALAHGVEGSVHGDPRDVPNEKAPSDSHDLNSWSLR